MSMTIEQFGLDRVSVEDRLALAEAIWDSVAREFEQSPITDEQKVELQRRLADSLSQPRAVTPWETIKARALARAKS